MTPIERACRAAHDEHNDTAAAQLVAADPDWDGWKSWIPVIRSVLTAIREPSEEMIQAAADCESSIVADVYTAMIDAALAD